ncbi:hypothetical protein BQ8482_160113 [Mesorhizobium delmotii]|uniref:Uncharacterized protein n=1 Tax=Mesorhizobium delmotii TaxID=1631247 RepID=A0A2P9AHN4_9HYPH|nr:hypothetical protein BQ8482_160113 [Mesorhizobium delmotii]
MLMPIVDALGTCSNGYDRELIWTAPVSRVRDRRVSSLRRDTLGSIALGSPRTPFQHPTTTT